MTPEQLIEDARNRLYSYTVDMHVYQTEDSLKSYTVKFIDVIKGNGFKEGLSLVEKIELEKAKLLVSFLECRYDYREKRILRIGIVLSKLSEQLNKILLDRIKNKENISLDTSPDAQDTSKSFTGKMNLCEERETSILQPILRTLVYRDKLRQAMASTALCQSSPEKSTPKEESMFSAPLSKKEVVASHLKNHEKLINNLVKLINEGLICNASGMVVVLLNEDLPDVVLNWIIEQYSEFKVFYRKDLEKLTVTTEFLS